MEKTNDCYFLLLFFQKCLLLSVIFCNFAASNKKWRFYMYYLIAKKKGTDVYYSVYWTDSLEDAATILKTFISHGILTYMTIGDNREEQPIPGYNCLSIDDCERG